VRPPDPVEPPSVDPGAESAPEPTVEPEPVAVEVAEPEPAPAVRPFAPVAESMPDPAEEEDLRITASEAIKPKRDLTPKPADPDAPTRHAKVISFANQKGGVAKTTSTLNLAVAFADSGHRVLCVDLDPQGNLTMSQGIDPDKVEKSMFDVLVHHIPIREAIQHK
jgi:Mrp family chromosome partitioning ATPase